MKARQCQNMGELKRQLHVFIDITGVICIIETRKMDIKVYLYFRVLENMHHCSMVINTIMGLLHYLN